MSIRKATLNLLQRSIEAYKQLEGEGTDFDVLFRGFSGRPVFLELEQQKYRKELRRIIRNWTADLRGRGPEALASMLIVLERRMQNAAERHIPKAYKLGVGNRKLTQDDQDKIQAALDSNRVFIQTSLLPAIDNRIRRAQEGEIGEEPPPFGSALQGALPFSENRAGLYAGLFWTAVWIGFGAALVKQFGSQAKTAIPVRRLLDPKSKHCITCPPKAGEYSSWDEMLAFTGGLPADGSDQCHSNCNCSLQVFISGEWVYTV